MGRPKAEINWKAVEAMCQIQCTLLEICAIEGVSKATLQRACKRDKGCTFETWSKQKGQGGKRSLRRRQFKAAMDGNVVMMIWLGKQWLGQTDKSAHTLAGDPQNKTPVPVRGLTHEFVDSMKKDIMGIV